MVHPFFANVHLWHFVRFGTICTIQKNVKNTHGGVLLLVKLQIAQNGTKLRKAVPNRAKRQIFTVMVSRIFQQLQFKMRTKCFLAVAAEYYPSRHTTSFQLLQDHKFYLVHSWIPWPISTFCHFVHRGN